MRVLVADDDKFVRHLVVYQLQKTGVQEVVQAGDGDEALSHWRREPFDLVVIDWEMPGRSGIDVVRAIRTDGSRVPILMVTVNTQRGQVVEAIEAGVSDYLPKPIDFDNLGDKLRRFCSHVDALKLLKQRTGESTRVEYLNPFITSIIHMFDTMLNVKITRETPFISANALPDNEVSGIIKLTGNARGAAVVSLGRETALRCTEQLLGRRVPSVNASVVDVVGEMANIVAGGAEAQMRQLNLKVSPPSVIIGRNHFIGFPANFTPVCVPFQCEWGPVSLQVGLKDQTQDLMAAEAASVQESTEPLTTISPRSAQLADAVGSEP